MTEVTPPPPPSTKVVFGTVEDDIFDAADPTDEFDGNNNFLFTGEGNDLVDVSTVSFGENRIYAGSGNDVLILGGGDRLLGDTGNDSFFVVSGGDNLITGGKDADQFWIATAQLPNAANTITDFELELDVIGIAGFGPSPNLDFGEDNNGNASLTLEGKLVATFLGISADELATANLTFA